MGSAQSLLDIMNDVSAAIERGSVQPPAPAAAKAMGEMEAFMALDPLLASLNKQYLDARAARLSVEKDFGADDPMTEVALLAEDSGWCAVQTRYMELRADRAMMRAAQDMMREAQAEAEDAQEAEQNRKALEKYYAFEAVLKTQRREEKNRAKEREYFWFMILGLWLNDYMMPQFLMVQPSYQFNRLAA